MQQEVRYTLQIIHSEIELSWLNIHEKEIQKKLKQKLDQLTRTKKLQPGVHTQKKQIDNAEEKFILRKKIVKEYKIKFDNEIWSKGLKIKENIEKRIVSLNLQSRLEQLYSRHAWLKKHVAIKEAFFSTILTNEVYFGVEQPFSFKNCPLNKNPHKGWNIDIKWKSIDEDQLKKIIEGYPFSRTHGNFTCYYSNYTIEVFKQSLRSRSTKKFDFFSNYTPNRVDIMVFLSNNGLKVKLIDNIDIPNYAPFHISEFEYFNSSQWKFFEILFVNVRTEDYPLWIILNKNNQEWVAYIYENFHLPRREANFFEKYHIRTAFININQNIQHNNIAMSTEAHWHAVLFGRVFPACREKLNVEDYRYNIPVFSLYEWTWKQIQPQYFVLKIKYAFLNRKPFTNFSLDALIFKGSNEDIPLLLEEENSTYICITKLLKKFDKGLFVINNDQKSLWIAPSCSFSVDLISALQIVYHAKLSRLTFPSIPDNYIQIKKLFTYNTSLKEIYPLDKSFVKSNTSYTYPFSCVARNRFLDAFASKQLEDISNDIQKRKKIWDVTGLEMIRFFNMHSAALDLDLINALIPFNEVWRDNFCREDDKDKLNDNKLGWIFLQITQMGNYGLDAFFNVLENNYANSWNNIEQESSPKINFTFDLGGSLSETQHEYITHLAKKINEFDSVNKQCNPLFSSVSLIMQNNLSKIDISFFMQLINALNVRNIKFPTDVPEARIYNLNIDNKTTESLLVKLYEIAMKDFFVLIRIPAWDREAYTVEQNGKLKALYRQVQNQILNNQRKRRQKILEKNIRYMYEAANGELNSDVIIADIDVQNEQSFNGENVLYPLSTQSLGIQQQLQQALVQEFQQEQEQEQEQIQEHNQQITLFEGNENDLISRDNIDVRCKQIWKSLPSEIKDLSGWTHGNLAQLFSLWVGSENNASQVIEKIHLQAVIKIMQNAAQFRFGVSKDNLPAGFSLKHSTNKNLILFFDEKLEKIDLRERVSLPIEKHNPFTIQLYTKTEPHEFSGDFRQFKKIFNANLSDSEALTQWKYLALEDKDARRMNNVRDALNKIKPGTKWLDENISASMQFFDFNGFNLSSEIYDFEDCLKQLKKSIIDSQQPLSPKVIHALLDTESAISFTTANLKAFGQLFYFYDAENNGQEKKGTRHFFFLANLIYETFGAEHFTVWKKRILDASLNWSELLNKTEIDAYAMSIVTLKNKLGYQKLWWKMVDVQGIATGYMHYSDLWYAFQKLVNYVEDKQLTIHNNVFFNCLSNYKNFNVKVFLDRLFLVLIKVKFEVEGNKIQQDIFDKIDQIDWRHNGFYYANQYNGYPYWKESLKLTEFLSASDPDDKSYSVNLDNKFSEDITAESIALTGLRFANYRVRLDFNNFERFSENLKSGLIVIKDQQKLFLITRLYLACLALGTEDILDDSYLDTASHFYSMNACNIEILQWINQSFSLDANLLKGTIKIRFRDIALLAETLLENFSLQDLCQLSCSAAVNFINNCGRAIQYYQSINSKNKFNFLLQRVSKNKKLSPLLNYYPWLLDYIDEEKKILNVKPMFSTCKNQIIIFEKQLQSIDFFSQTYLPSYLELEKAYSDISNAVNSTALRKEIIETWILKGCTISYQNADFKPVSEEGYHKSKKFLEKFFYEGYKKQNLFLFKKLTLHLAVLSESDCYDQMKNLIKFFIHLNKKNYYNEVGQLIGCLLQKVKSSTSIIYYSVPQLTTFLSIFIDKNKILQQHYPINLLNTVLDEIVKNPQSSLMNRQLNKLEAMCEGNQQKIIERIIRNLLPDFCKSILIKLLLRENRDFDHVLQAEQSLLKLQMANVSKDWLSASAEMTEVMALKKIHSFNVILFRVTKTAEQVILNKQKKPILEALWEKSQITLIKWIKEEWISQDELLHIFEISDCLKSPYVQIILTQAISDRSNDFKYIYSLKHELSYRSVDELINLATYYAAPPYPNIRLLERLLKLAPKNSVEKIIHDYESIELSLNEIGICQRHYSITLNDRQSLNRILNGLKRKGQPYLLDIEKNELLNLFYYTNCYAESLQLDCKLMQDLQKNLYSNLRAFNISSSREKKHQSSARILACMREILLRKTGKWINHTQMLDLIYAALYNNESLLHQVRTGQGKSIITVIRVSYLALTGFVVDVFSAKNSLSMRDHEEFAPVLDAMGLRHAYITETSGADAYKVVSEVPEVGTLGAVNYATIGNLSLFFSKHIWQAEHAMHIYDANRVAFVDECDHILIDVNTQFNYSDNPNCDSIYDVDAWLYRVAYDFYLKNKESFNTENENMKIISRNNHLKALCSYLQQSYKQETKQSTFLKKYIIPALSNDPEALKKRDQKLRQLLIAAHTADSLKEGVHFCKRSEILNLANGDAIRVRFAKVMINNQIQPGSTYSDLVHQFLHVRLNQEAVAVAEAPDFIVQPYTEIALSENVGYFLNKYYSKLEGCSGTAGNAYDLELYKKFYGICHVVKIPCHEIIKTEFLPSLFCESEEEQINSLVNTLINHSDQPILITCEDDIAVKRIYRQIIEQLKLKQPSSDHKSIILDTNDSDKTESQILPMSGRAGVVTISSRLGRGTDIKPESKKGLIVLRTYAKNPRISKQEYGRQGRNGANGTCQDIFDYAVIQKQYAELANSPDHKDRLLIIKNEQSAHLDRKIEKHTFNKSQKFASLANPQNREKYIKIRSLMQLKNEIKQKQDRFLRRKEFVVASMSGNVKEVLNQYILNDGINSLHVRLREGWLESRKKIESIWQARLAGKLIDNEKIYQDFFEKATEEWGTLCRQFIDLDYFLTLNFISNDNSTVLIESIATREQNKAKEDLIFWNEKLKYKNFLAEDSKHLKILRKNILEKLLIFHPDKKAGYDAFAKILINLKECIDKCMDVINYAKMPAEQNSEVAKDVKNSTTEASIILYNQLRDQNTALGNDTETFIHFYQEWLIGAKKYIDKKNTTLLNFFYKEFDQFFNQLFLATVKYSLYNPPSFRQKKNCIELFSYLKKITQNRAVYYISCSAWSALVEMLSSADEVDIPYYMQAVEHFFRQSWLAQKLANTLTAEDMLKNDILLKLTLGTISTGYVPSKLENFIDNFTQAVHQYFWHNFTYIIEIKRIFAEKKKLTKLLMCYTNKADIAYIISLLSSNQDDGLNDRINLLFKYFKTNLAALNASPQIIKPLFDIALSVNQSSIDILPDANCLLKLSDVGLGKFWYFLSQRLVKSQEECNDLICILNSQEENWFFYEQSFNPLIKISAHVPLSYINKQLMFVLGKYAFEYCENNILSIKEAGDALNNFLFQKGIIKSTIAYQVPRIPEKRALYNAYLNCFEGMSPKQNQMVFSLLVKEKYSNISDKVQLILVENVAKNKINYLVALEKVLFLFKDTAGLGLSIQDKFLLKFSQILNAKPAEIDQQIDRMRMFVALIKRAKIGDQLLSHLFNHWENLWHDETWNLLFLKILKQIDKFMITYPSTIDFMFNYLDNVVNKPTDELEIDLNFFKSSNALKDKKISEAAFIPFWKARFYHSRTDLQLLSYDISVLRDVHQLVINKNYGIFFDEFSVNQSRRQLFLQYLYHDLLNIADLSIDDCWGNYWQLIHKQLEPVPAIIVKNFQDRLSLTDRFQRLICVVKELAVITKSPFNDIKIEEEEVTIDKKFLAAQLDYIDEYRVRYLKTWFTNQRRKDQAFKFFKELKKVAVGDSFGSFYELSFKKIIKTQQAILQSDKDFCRNKLKFPYEKGYSRLYDITSQIFLRMAQDCLTNQEVRLHTKNNLHDLLHQQLVFQVQILSGCLDEDTKLKGLANIMPAADRSVSNTEVIKGLKKFINDQYNNVPKHLRYVCENINNLIPIDEDEPLRQAVNFS